MKWNMFFGALLGFIIVFLIFGFVRGEFQWSQLTSLLIGVCIAYTVITIISNKKGK